jgi:hypothetical protein
MLRVNGRVPGELESWHGLESFPCDGRLVEVKDTAGDVWLAGWNGRAIEIDADEAVTPTAWRQVSR